MCQGCQSRPAACHSAPACKAMATPAGSGSQAMAAGALVVGDVDLDPGGRTVRSNGKPVELTGVEFNLLEVLLRAAGRLVEADGKPVRLVVGSRNPRRQAQRPRTYDQAVKKLLVGLWECFDQMCGKRLVAGLP